MRAVVLAVAGFAAIALTVVPTAFGGDYPGAVMADHPSGYWRLEESDGATTAVDASGYGRNGTYRGVYLGVDGPLGADDETSASFDAAFDSYNSDDMFVPNTAALDFSDGDFSVEAWVRTTDTDGGRVIVAQSDMVAPYWSITTGADGRIHAMVQDGGGILIQRATGPAVTTNDGGWHHVVVTFDRGEDATKTQIYVDGVLAETTARSRIVPDGRIPTEEWDSIGVHVGDSPGAPDFKGEIDEVAVYPFILSAARVKAHLDAVGTPQQDSLEPLITSDERARAIAIAKADPRFTQLLAGQTYSFTDAGLWLGAGDNGRTGAELIVNWPDTISVSDYDWPSIGSDDDTSATYTEGTSRYGVSGLRELDVLVDLGRNRLVSMEPSGDYTETYPAQPLSAFTMGAATTSLGPAESRVAPGRTHNLRKITKRLVKDVGSDWFYNYDFKSERVGVNNVDWPVNLIFTLNADRYKVKDLLSGSFFASDMHMYLHDAEPYPPGLFSSSPAHDPIWVTDGGSYNGGLAYTCTETKLHMRVYAPTYAQNGANRLFNLTWAFYVVATSHYDHHEPAETKPLGGCPDYWVGKSEKAEREIAGLSAKKWGTIPNSGTPGRRGIRLFNYERVRKSGHRRWSSNGYATLIGVIG